MNFEKLASLGALGVAGGTFVAWAGLAFLANTTPVGGVVGSTGGIDPITRNVSWISSFVPALILILVHVQFAKQLKRGAASLND